MSIKPRNTYQSRYQRIYLRPASDKDTKNKWSQFYGAEAAYSQEQVLKQDARGKDIDAGIDAVSTGRKSECFYDRKCTYSSSNTQRIRIFKAKEDLKLNEMGDLIAPKGCSDRGHRLRHARPGRQGGRRRFRRG